MTGHQLSPLKKKLKSIVKAKQGVYIGVLCLNSPSLCFGLIFVRGKLKPANSSGFNLYMYKYTPLRPVMAFCNMQGDCELK